MKTAQNSTGWQLGRHPQFQFSGQEINLILAHLGKIANGNLPAILYHINIISSGYVTSCINKIHTSRVNYSPLAESTSNTAEKLTKLIDRFDDLFLADVAQNLVSEFTVKSGTERLARLRTDLLDLPKAIRRAELRIIPSREHNSTEAFLTAFSQLAAIYKKATGLKITHSITAGLEPTSKAGKFVNAVLSGIHGGYSFEDGCPLSRIIGNGVDPTLINKTLSASRSKKI